MAAKKKSAEEEEEEVDPTVSGGSGGIRIDGVVMMTLGATQAYVISVGLVL